MRLLYLALALLVAACTRSPASAVAISLRHGTASERATKAQLERLLATHDLAAYRYTDRVAVDDDAIPHSHPVLTLHTRHLRDDLLLLSTFIHEQSHWYLVAHPHEVAAAVDELRALAPGLPVGFPDGAQSETSSYEHLVVIALEEVGLQRTVGELAARQAMEFWAGDHYRALYRLVLDRRAEVWRVMRAHGLTGAAAR